MLYAKYIVGLMQLTHFKSILTRVSIFVFFTSKDRVILFFTSNIKAINPSDNTRLKNNPLILIDGVFVECL